jgi:4-diphosphocytidyl-2-C-methyl-D-erythritol kinase
MGELYTLNAPAKINLLLRITGKRADGFHELVTLFHPLPALCDTLRADLTAQEGITLSCSHPGVPEDGSNLLCKAASRFAEAGKIMPSWHFELEKNIPVAAGLGGGSSDAGTLLKFLDEKFPGVPREKVKDIARSIGADVPFFLAPADAAARGIGEKLEYTGQLTVPPVLLVFPDFPVSAAWAYRHLQGMTPQTQAEDELAALTEALRSQDFSKAAKLCANDLEHALFAKFPLLNHLRRHLEEEGALCVHVSGSGPTLFALFENENLRHKAAESLARPENLEAGLRIMEC